MFVAEARGEAESNKRKAESKKQKAESWSNRHHTLNSIQLNG
jgi:hypothetical protein